MQETQGKAGHAEHDRGARESHGDHEHANHDHTGRHAHMVADFRGRFWIALALTLPVLVLSPMLQGLAGLKETLRFRGSGILQFAFATAIFFYGGWPFLKGLFDELAEKQPGMMTLIGGDGR